LRQLDDFRDVWIVDFAFSRPPGERPTPLGLAAMLRRTGHLVHLGHGRRRRQGPPYPLRPDSLLVAYDAPAAFSPPGNPGHCVPWVVL
jgi:hypothetical protein